MKLKLKVSVVFICTLLLISISSHAQENCKKWADKVCKAFGAVNIGCGYEGPALTAKGLILDPSILKSLGFSFYDGSYFITVHRIDKERYKVGVQSANDPAVAQELILKPNNKLESYVSDNRPKGPYGFYYWDAAIEYDLLDQVGLIPSKRLATKLIREVDLLVARPEITAYFGLKGLQRGTKLSLIYQSRNLWHIVRKNTQSGLVLKYLSDSWSIYSSIKRPKPITAKKPEKTTLLFKNSDFETGSLLNWHADGRAVEFQPTMGDNIMARHRGPANHQGRFWIGTYEKYTGASGQSPGNILGDKPTGILSSTEFIIERDRISFLIGGGRKMSSIYAALVINGRQVQKTTGENREKMKRVFWDVTAYKGKKAQIWVKDNSTTGFGHINVDDFRYPAKGSSTKADQNRPLKTERKPETSAPTTQSQKSHKPPADDEIEDQTMTEVDPDDDYNGWFPFPEYGWTALPAQSRSIAGSKLEVRKNYTRIKDQALLSIMVTAKKMSQSNNNTLSKDQDPFQELIGSILGEVLKQGTNTGQNQANNSQTMTHQGRNGRIKENNNKVTIEFEDQRFRVIVNLNRRDTQIAQTYARELDLNTMAQVFIIKYK